jgi:hypothetical protein
MPLVQPSTFTSPFGLSNGHVQTLYAHFRRVNNVEYTRERITTPDGDFLDLDWSANGHKRIVILSHGLEGHTTRPYMLGMARALNRHGWDVLAWNYRSCSGETNRKLRWYHSGETGDLRTVIGHVADRGKHTELALIGFSLGGNITLKYLGEKPEQVNPLISKAVAFSVPCDLKSSAHKLARPANWIYMKRFLRTLHQKVKAKMKLFPELISDDGFHKIKNFVEFDDRYTAPIHGFKDAYDYFDRCSSRQFLPNIRVPALLVNARNDPFLDKPSFPYPEAEASTCFFLETPEKGGHMGFTSRCDEYWSESRALSFLECTTSDQLVIRP